MYPKARDSCLVDEFKGKIYYLNGDNSIRLIIEEKSSTPSSSSSLSVIGSDGDCDKRIILQSYNNLYIRLNYEEYKELIYKLRQICNSFINIMHPGVINSFNDAIFIDLIHKDNQDKLNFLCLGEESMKKLIYLEDLIYTELCIN